MEHRVPPRASPSFQHRSLKNVPGEQRGWSPKVQDARLVAGAQLGRAPAQVLRELRDLADRFAGYLREV